MRILWKHALLVVVMFLTGGVASACYWWEPSAVSPMLVVAEEAPSRVRVTRPDGEVLTIDDPTFEADSVKGTAMRDSVRIAVSDIERLEVWRLRRLQTVASVIFGLIFVTALIGSQTCCI